MPAFLRVNLPYKIAALVFAVLLHFYVVTEQAPARVITVPLTVTGLAPNLLLGDDTPRQVMLTLNGPPDELERLSATDVGASIDLTHAAAGRNVVVPVLVNAPDTVQADPNPSVVSVDLMPRETRRMQVSAADPGHVLPGYGYEKPEVSPKYVSISGSQEAVDSVARVVASAAPSSAVGTVDGDFSVIALDAQGSQVQDVTITPSHAHVKIEMVSEPSMRNAVVTANIAGALPLSMQVTGVAIRPRLVLITGSPARLSQITSIGTAPVNIAGATGTVTQTVKCIAPPGVKFPAATAVVVTVQIAAVNPSNPASPLPTPGTAAPGAPQ